MEKQKAKAAVKRVKVSGFYPYWCNYLLYIRDGDMERCFMCKSLQDAKNIVKNEGCALVTDLATL